jgi:hypothetical protein
LSAYGDVLLVLPGQDLDRVKLRGVLLTVAKSYNVTFGSQRALASMQILQLLSRSLEITGPILSRSIRPRLSSVLKNLARCPRTDDGSNDGDYSPS